MPLEKKNFYLYGSISRILDKVVLIVYVVSWRIRFGTLDIGLVANASLTFLAQTWRVLEDATIEIVVFAQFGLVACLIEAFTVGIEFFARTKALDALDRANINRLHSTFGQTVDLFASVQCFALFSTIYFKKRSKLKINICFAYLKSFEWWWMRLERACQIFSCLTFSFFLSFIYILSLFLELNLFIYFFVEIKKKILVLVGMKEKFRKDCSLFYLGFLLNFIFKKRERRECSFLFNCVWHIFLLLLLQFE